MTDKMRAVYGEAYGRLSAEIATIIFIKRDGTIRSMLATRNLQVVRLLFEGIGNILLGHDKRCNIGNGNLAVVDLLLGEPRQFNIERIVSITWHGEANTLNDIQRIVEEHTRFKQAYDEALSRVQEAQPEDIDIPETSDTSTTDVSSVSTEDNEAVLLFNGKSVTHQV